jgi:hypothetical protein
MTIRRSGAALLATFVVLVGGVSLAGCAGPVDANIGTSANDPQNRSGNDPSGVSQGGLPRLSDRVHDNGRSSGEQGASGG